MIKIWAKILKDNKIIKQTVYQKNESMDYSEFLNHIIEICYELDIPTPVIIKNHIFNYAKYNTVRFTKSDFVDSVDFDKFVIENINR